MTKPGEESFFDSRAAILASIPHRAPFLFVDQIVEITEQGIKCAYRFKEDEYFFQGHYPSNPIVPGVILCEAAMQAGAVYYVARSHRRQRREDEASRRRKNERREIQASSASRRTHRGRGDA